MVEVGMAFSLWGKGDVFTGKCGVAENGFSPPRLRASA
jgi:hypothetical protein